MKKSILSLIFSISIITSYSQEYIVFGNAATHKGETLKMYKYSDNVTKTKKLISEATVKENGDFSFIITEKDTIPAFIDLDVFIGQIILESGTDLEIVLPKRTSKSEADIMNPYFKPFKFYIRILNNNKSMSSKIRHFNYLYDKSLKIVLKDRKHINSGEVEKEIIKIKDSVNFIPNSFFANYCSYKFLYLRHLTFYKNKKGIIRKDFSKQAPLTNNPAYNEMINQIFSSIVFETSGSDLYEYLAADYGWNAYMSLLKKDVIYSNKEFREYIFLHNLYELFYKKRTYQKAILKLLRSAQKSDLSKNSEIIVNNFINKTSHFIVGNPAQDFMLYDDTGFETSLNDFEGDFVYLCFYNNDSYACKKDISTINTMSQKKIEGLKIITIYVGQDINFIKNIKEENKYNWTFLRCNANDNLLKDYNVVAFPTYYLINPEGKLSLVPAPSPSENFEKAYFKIFIDRKRNKIRNN